MRPSHREREKTDAKASKAVCFGECAELDSVGQAHRENVFGREVDVCFVDY
jgi:hypothetical protein